MPCCCWYTPHKEDERYIKDRCVEIVNKIKELNKEGDPIGLSLWDVKKLLDHLYSGDCDERPIR